MKTQKEIQSLENEQAVVRKEMAGLLKEMGL